MVLFHHLKDCDSYFKVKAILLYKYVRTIIPHLDKQNAPPAIYLSLETLFNKYQPSFDIIDFVMTTSILNVYVCKVEFII